MLRRQRVQEFIKAGAPSKDAEAPKADAKA